MGHHHQHHSSNEKVLKLAIGLNIVITIAQVLGGFWSGSMALITDALHNFMDVAALVISLIAILLAKRPSTKWRSFGYKRAETLASLINSVAIVVVALVIMIESINRLLYTRSAHIDGDLVIVLAGVAIVVNGLSAWLLHRGAAHSMNMKSAFLHLVSDTLFSVAVLVGGVLIKYQQIYWVDGALSILIAIYLIYSSLPLIKRCIKIIMQFAPNNFDLEEIQKEVESIEGVINLHHVHIWELDEHDIHLEGHLEMDEKLSLKSVCEILKNVESLLEEKYHISHVTLQPESGRCTSFDLIHNH